MATFKAIALEHHIKSDGTVRIKILITHYRQKRYIDTGIVAHKTDLTKEYEIKTRAFKDSLHETIKGYRDKCNRYPEKVAQMSCDELVLFLAKPEVSKDLDFIDFANDYMQSMIQSGRERSTKDYQTDLNALMRFTELKSLPVKEITVAFLQGFATWLTTNPANKENKKSTMLRTPSHYIGSIRTLHNQMKLQFNDEDSGQILISGSPFSRFKGPKPPSTKKRALSPENISKIYELPYLKEIRGSGSSRYNLAKDCFLLSFMLIGMNSTDLYRCTSLIDKKLTYNRMKTK